MDVIAWVALGAAVLVGVSILGGLIIRQTRRAQKGGAFYVSIVCMLLAFSYGVIPYLALAGFERAVAYGLSAAVSALVSQLLFGEKLPQS